jgi:heat-inducible transcriptional repressor
LATPVLDIRQREVLEMIIDCYRRTAEPVGSRTVARRYGINLSPATIRNTMADLEDLGYVKQPHTSAGRVPTELGYRVYIDSLMKFYELSPREKDFIREGVTTSIVDLETIMEQTSRILSEISHYIGIALTPELHEGTLRHLELIPIDTTSDDSERQRRVLAVLVMASGTVKNHVVLVHKDLSGEDIHRIKRILNEKLSGLPLKKIQQISQDAMQLKALFDPYLSEPVAAFTRDTFSLDKGTHVYLDGASNFFSQPEFLEVQKIEPLFRLLEQKDQIADLLTPRQSPDIQVLIGSENACEGMELCSVVCSGYSIHGDMYGTIGVIGPTRMEYSRIVSIVSFTARCISQMF